MKPELITAHQGQVEYKLQENHPLRLVHAVGHRIECVSGTAWITAYGQNTDFMLRAGQTFEVPNDGLILIEAVGEGRVKVRLPARPLLGWSARLAQRLRDKLHGAAAGVRHSMTGASGKPCQDLPK
jgi:hypothetical protein